MVARLRVPTNAVFPRYCGHCEEGLIGEGQENAKNLVLSAEPDGTKVMHGKADRKFAHVGFFERNEECIHGHLS